MTTTTVERIQPATAQPWTIPMMRTRIATNQPIGSMKLRTFRPRRRQHLGAKPIRAGELTMHALSFFLLNRVAIIM